MSATLALTLDAPGVTCYFDSHGCSRLVEGVGGFDQHHADPVEFGGDPHQPLLPLCPVHHRRQHAGLRYVVERHLAGEQLDPAVMRRFTRPERLVILRTRDAWVARGCPPIPGWSAPAARAL